MSHVFVYPNRQDGVADSLFLRGRELCTARTSAILMLLMVTASAGAQNLLTNGDFERGNTGFATGYNFTGVGVTERTYDIVSNPRLVHGLATSYGDHPCGNGLMMVVNGAASANVDVWRQTVAVQPHQQYRWSVYMSTWYAPSPARMSFRINGQQVATQNLTSVTGRWDLFQYFWNSGTSTTATLSIVDTNLDFGGNDFAIDDLYFGLSGVSAPSGLDLYLTRIEVNQSVQDANQTMPLIAGKPTMVRAFVDFSDSTAPSRAQVTNVDAILHVFVNGVEQQPPITSQNGPVTIQHGMTGASLNDAVNFVFTPPPSADVDLVVDVNPGPRRIFEPNYCNNRLRRDNLNFRCLQAPKVRYVSIDYRPTAPGSGTNYPNASDMVNAAQMMQTAYPSGADYALAGTATMSFPLNQGTQPSLFLALSLIRSKILPQVGEPLYVFGWLPSNSNITIAGGAAVGSVGWGHCASGTFAKQVLAHEVGHMFGLCHVPSTGGFDLCFGSFGTFPTGALGGYGVDVPQLYAGARIKAPANSCNLCPSPDISGSMCSMMLGGCHAGPSHRWIDTVSYSHIASSPRLQCSSLAGSPSGHMLAIGGVFNPNQNAGSIDAVTDVPFAAATENDAGGNIIVRGRTAGSPTVLREVRTIAAPVPDDDGTGQDQMVYFLYLPAEGADPPYDAIDEIQLVYADTDEVLATRTRSAHPPAGGIVTPSDGTTLTNGMLIEWIGWDDDNDPLRYTITYSPDYGQHSIPIVVNTDQTSFVLDAQALPATVAPGSGVLGFTVSDGMNEPTGAIVGLTLDDPKPPTVDMLSPGDGAEFAQGAGVPLLASASDLEDGSIPAGQILWTSSIDGLIASGPSAVASNLSLGTHILSVTVTDSSSLSASQSAIVTISARTPGLPGDLDMDGDVDGDDAAMFAAALGASGTDPLDGIADLDGDGVVGCNDWVLLKSHWTGPPAAPTYLLACRLRGDLNCDGVVNNFDIDAFVQALIFPADYAVAYPSCGVQNGDIDNDGNLNNFDIDGFVSCVLNAGCP